MHFTYLASRKTHYRLLRGPLLISIAINPLRLLFPVRYFHYHFSFLLPCFFGSGFYPLYYSYVFRGWRLPAQWNTAARVYHDGLWLCAQGSWTIHHLLALELWAGNTTPGKVGSQRLLTKLRVCGAGPISYPVTGARKERRCLSLLAVNIMKQLKT